MGVSRVQEPSLTFFMEPVRQAVLLFCPPRTVSSRKSPDVAELGWEMVGWLTVPGCFPVLGIHPLKQG